MDTRVRLLVEIFDQAYRAPSWHGTPLKGTLRGVSARDALWRPGLKRHCIWELVLHTAYWKCMVRRRLLRDAEISFPRSGANWPELPPRTNEAAWRRDLALLRDQHRLLRAVVARFPATRLNARGWRSSWTNAQHVYGIASHDLYHAGQVQLLKALRRR